MAMKAAIMFLAQLLLIATVAANAGGRAAEPAAAETVPAAPPVTVPEAPASEAGTNAMTVLEKAGCHMFMSMLKNTRTVQLIQSLLSTEDSQGLTILAPTDEAFAELKPGMLNSLSEEQKMQLMQYHVLDKYYSQGQLQDASNPVLTMATGGSGRFGFNVTSSGASNSSVNITTGVDSTSVVHPFYSEAPLAVYRINRVLLPSDIFGAKKPHRAAAVPPAAAASAPTAERKAPVPAGSVSSESPASVRDSDDDDNSSLATAITAPAASMVFAFFLFAVAGAVGAS